MNAQKGKIQCEGYDTKCKTSANNNNAQVSLKTNSSVDPKTNEKIFNYSRDSAPNKESDELDEVLEKLLIAYEYMTPAVEEIITTLSNFIMPKMQTYTQDDPICSVTMEQYDEVIKAVLLIKDATVKKKPENKSILDKFPLDKFLSAIKCSIKVGSVTTSTFRVYLEKNVVNELILLYKLLYDEIQDINCSSDCESEITPSTHRRISNLSQKLQQNIIENSEKLASLEAEYQALSDTINILKSVISESSGCDKITGKSSSEVVKKEKPSHSASSLKTNQCVTDVSGARRCILECLYELNEVRKHLKFSDSHEDLEIKSNNISILSKMDCCNKQDIPHLHAKLNGIPIVLTLNKMVFQQCLINSAQSMGDNISTVLYIPLTSEQNIEKYIKQTNHEKIFERDKVKHRTCHTITSINPNSLKIKVAYTLNQNHSPKSVLPTCKNVIADKLKSYIYIRSAYELDQRIYEVRYFEVEHDSIDKDKNTKERLPTVKECKIKKGLNVNLDDASWNSDALEVRVFEFKRKNVPKAKEVIEQLKTKIKSGYFKYVENDNEMSNDAKGSITVIDHHGTFSAVNVFTYTKNVPKEPPRNPYENRSFRHNLDFNQYFPNKNNNPIKTCNVGVNVPNANDKLASLRQTYKLLEELCSPENSRDLFRLQQKSKFEKKNNCYERSEDASTECCFNQSKDLIIMPSWEKDKRIPLVDSSSSYNSGCGCDTKKIVANVAVQCNFLNVPKKTKMCQTYLSRTTQRSPWTTTATPGSINKILSNTEKLQKISNSQARIRRNNRYLVRKKLSNLNRSLNECYKLALNKRALRERLQNYLKEATVYSLKVDPTFKKNFSKRTGHFVKQTPNVNGKLFNTHKKLPEQNKPKSVSNLTTPGNKLDESYNTAKQNEWRKFFINLMQTEASIVFENLGYKMSNVSNQQNECKTTVATNTVNRSSSKIVEKQKNGRIGAVYCKEVTESSSDISVASTQRTYSNVQFVLGDVTPTQNCKIFGISRSSSNIDLVISAECSNLKTNTEKELHLARKNFDYAKYNTLACDLPVLTKNNTKVNYVTNEHVIHNLDSFYKPGTCNKSTQLPPIIFRSKSLLKQSSPSFFLHGKNHFSLM